jgi:hypothetical protein
MPRSVAAPTRQAESNVVSPMGIGKLYHVLVLDAKRHLHP